MNPTHPYSMCAAATLAGIASLTALSACSGSTDSNTWPDTPPNIIYILADDLGYGELGSFGQTKIETPHLDELAEQGMMFTQHYSGSPVCAPARAILLTGKHAGRVQVRGNDEWGSRGDVWSYRAMIADSTLEGQRPMRTGTSTIGTLMQQAGYTTGIFGKWGLGAPHTESVPNKMGFDHFFGYNCQRMAHTFTPVHLWENDRRVPMRNDTIAPHTGLPQGADPYDPASYAMFDDVDYSPDHIFASMSAFIDRNADRPFFIYWATPIPHVPLQAPREWIDYYVEKFGDEEPYTGGRGYFPVRYPRATYAAMVSYLDARVGELVEQLKAQGLYENTLIIFTSDNGPTFNGGADSPWFNSGGPFPSEFGYGKTFVREGGIRVPMIATWPAAIRPGTQSDHPSVFYDVKPTLAEITGQELSTETDGISFLPAMLGQPQRAHEFLYWEYPGQGGQMAVRIGDFKALRLQMHQGNRTWQLFNIVEDPHEANDLADLHPEIIERVEAIVATEHRVPENELWQFEIMTNP